MTIEDYYIKTMSIDDPSIFGINTAIFEPRFKEKDVSTSEPIETENSVVKQTKKIPRRSIKRAKTSDGIAPGTPWIPKTSKECFRDSILAKVDPIQYHALVDCESKDHLIKIANKSLPSQIERFEYDCKSFIIVTWLTTVRIYEYYSNDHGHYVEVKRIPERYIRISPRLVTSLHYNDSKLYIAYLKGCEHEGVDGTKPYLEIRHLNGKLLDKPYSYDETISMIHSDNSFIYLKTISDVIYIHHKDIFTVKYKVILKPFITCPLTGFRIDAIRNLNHTKFRLLFTSADELLISNFDIFEHQVIHCFRFKGSHKIVSLERINHLYIIHRNLSTDASNIDPKEPLSRIECGFTSRTGGEDEFHFLHELSLSFKNRLIQIKAYKENLYVFGYINKTWDNSKSYQIGCVYLPSPKLQWVKYFSGKDADDVNDDCHILANDNNIAIIKTRQQMSCIKIETNLKYECKECKLKFFSEDDFGTHKSDDHESIFTNFNVFTNKYLQDLGASVFKKLTTLGE